MYTLALCIPAYNASWCLPRLIASAQKQEIPFDEILVYNDCSTDNTAEIAKSLGVTVVEGDINVGCSVGKNRLTQFAKSKWIHFHDADDELMPNFTRLAHRWMSQKDCPDVVLFDYEWRDNDTNEILMLRHFERERLEKDPIAYAILEQINPFCGLYKKDKILAVGGYDIDPKVLYNEDVAFHIKLAIHGLSFSAESEVSIINYRVGGSMSASNQLKCIQAHYEVLAKAAKIIGNKYPKELSSKLWKASGSAAACNDYITADQCVELASQLTNCKYPQDQDVFFTLICRINPFLAIRLRESMIRIFKPYLRKA